MTNNQEGIAEGHLSACEEENRELRAENERLQKEALHFNCRGMIAERDEQIEDLRAENQRLKADAALTRHNE